MTKKEIISRGNFCLAGTTNNGFNTFKVTLHIPLFNKEVNLEVYNLTSLDSEIELDLITELVNELLSFNHLHEVWLKKAIWSHYDSSVSNTSYNFVTVNGFENEREANMAFFGIHSQEEVYTSADIEYVWVDVSIVDFRYYNLVFCCPWEGEHGISIGVKNGEIDSII